MGSLGILNVGAGDTKLTFDKSNPQELIRSARIVTDMLKRGYALLIEEPPGRGTYQRVREFRETTAEYIIADYDPTVAAESDHAEVEPDQEAPASPTTEPEKPRKRGSKSSVKAVSATSTRGIAVSRSAGG